MDDLVQFLRARLDEDEQTARAASPGPWKPGEEHDEVVAVDDITVAEGFALSGQQLRATVDHIARHDPARVLADVAAKRMLLDASSASCPPGCSAEHAFRGSCALRWMGPVHEEDDGRWLHDDTGARFMAPPVTSEWTLRVSALPYSAHPDYRPEWRP
ncbi:DUF6221 family protein [Streptomyces sp. NPDC059447]|uniref:DUF6221 family protein n=1 Tax=Streptomyces sp. NPDC059447 TaxID=3346834 RepID=UPI0036C5751E